MWCKCLPSVALATAFLALLASRTVTADDARQPVAASHSSGELRITEPGEVQLSDQDIAEPPVLAAPSKQGPVTPTPAKRKPTAEAMPVQPTAKPQPADQSAT